METNPSLLKGKHKLTDITQHIVKKPAYDISTSHRKRKNDFELEDDEKSSKILSEYYLYHNVQCTKHLNWN